MMVKAGLFHIEHSYKYILFTHRKPNCYGTWQSNDGQLLVKMYGHYMRDENRRLKLAKDVGAIVGFRVTKLK